VTKYLSKKPLRKERFILVHDFRGLGKEGVVEQTNSLHDGHETVYVSWLSPFPFFFCPRLKTFGCPH
jgi:hypothetical protein